MMKGSPGAWVTKVGTLSVANHPGHSYWEPTRSAAVRQASFSCTVVEDLVVNAGFIGRRMPITTYDDDAHPSLDKAVLNPAPECTNGRST